MVVELRDPGGFTVVVLGDVVDKTRYHVSYEHDDKHDFDYVDHTVDDLPRMEDLLHEHHDASYLDTIGLEGRIRMRERLD